MPFDPADHIIKLKGKDYIEVKWRLVWLRSEHPDASLVTEMLRYDEREAVFRAVVTIPGGGIGVGHGSEKPADFGDYCEKAETKAIGRALGALGYGTQFVDEHEMGEGASHRLVDSPVQRSQPATRQQPPNQAKNQNRPASGPATPAAATPTPAAEKADRGDRRLAVWLLKEHEVKSDKDELFTIIDHWLTGEFNVGIKDFGAAPEADRDKIMAFVSKPEVVAWLEGEKAGLRD